MKDNVSCTRRWRRLKGSSYLPLFFFEWIELKPKMFDNLTKTVKIMGPRACMYILCIGILIRYVHNDIMWPFPFLWRSVTCNMLCSTKSSLRVMHTSSIDESMSTYADRVWRSTIHPTLPAIGKRKLSCYDFKR